jgi:hypothetical protein
MVRMVQMYRSLMSQVVDRNWGREKKLAEAADSRQRLCRFEWQRQSLQSGQSLQAFR